MDSLPTLQDISGNFKASEEIVDIEDIKECLFTLIGEYITNNLELYKYEDFNLRVIDGVYNYYTDLNLQKYEEFPIDIELLIEEMLNLYLILNNNCRSYVNTSIIKQNDKERNKEILASHLNKQQPEQRTPEWFEFRHNRLTASDFYKVFDTQSLQNNLILKKCQPIDTKKFSGVNTDSACHHGHKYEPLSLFIYEKKYNTKVGEYGCISHSDYNFIGASPDGINIDETNERYCRLVEVKNPVSRIISGNPKKDYWVQMQLQMEVWNLDECDFLETMFKEYEDEEKFNEDGDFNLTKSGDRKGIIVQFYDKEPIYEYAPIDCTKEEFEKWYDETMDKNDKITWVQNIYWRLEKYSCVLVPRNKKWFNSKIDTIKEFWKLILKERETGYEHRRPKKKEKKTIVIKIPTQPFLGVNTIVPHS
jgi:putative phage-type endonuclease